MLYIIRHGKTDWNSLNKLQGQTDVPLNDEGAQMALKAQLDYQDVHFDVCYTSPLSRAKETARIVVGDRSIPIIEDDRLKEMSFGEYEGTLNYFEDESLPINIFFKHPEEYKESIGGAETIDDLFKRTGEFLNDVIYPSLKDNKDILIVGHGAMNCSIITQVMNMDISDFWSAGIENCKLKKLM